jgi:hypothetical protein
VAEWGPEDSFMCHYRNRPSAVIRPSDFVVLKRTFVHPEIPMGIVKVPDMLDYSGWLSGRQSTCPKPPVRDRQLALRQQSPALDPTRGPYS